MPNVTPLAPLDTAYGAVLRARKAHVVSATDDQWTVAQYGAAHIPVNDWPGWAHDLSTTEPVIETYVASPDGVMATSDNEPFVSAWQPLVEWMNLTVRAALADVDVHLGDAAYVTASLTPTNSLEGLAHLDDALFVPDDSVSMVAIIGELAGPRVATTEVTPAEIRPMTTLTFDQRVLDAFANDELDRCAAGRDELVVFPQFGQIHAGPAAHHVADMAPSRQLLVMRAPIVAD